MKYMLRPVASLVPRLLLPHSQDFEMGGYICRFGGMRPPSSAQNGPDDKFTYVVVQIQTVVQTAVIITIACLH